MDRISKKSYLIKKKNGKDKKTEGFFKRNQTQQSFTPNGLTLIYNHTNQCGNYNFNSKRLYLLSITLL